MRVLTLTCGQDWLSTWTYFLTSCTNIVLVVSCSLVSVIICTFCASMSTLFCLQFFPTYVMYCSPFHIIFVKFRCCYYFHFCILFFKLLGNVNVKPRVYRKQLLYLYEVEVRSAYTLSFPNPTCGIPVYAVVVELKHFFPFFLF